MKEGADMKKKVGTFKIWLLAIAAVVAFSVLPKVSSLATEDQALVVKENMQEAADAAGDESSVENKQETAGEGANLEAQGLEIPVSKVKVSATDDGSGVNEVTFTATLDGEAVTVEDVDSIPSSYKALDNFDGCWFITAGTYTHPEKE